MKLKFTILSTTLILALVSCKKEDDPFFDSFPKKYVYITTHEVEGTRMFRAGAEISDTSIINEFTKDYDYFTIEGVEEFYKDIELNFANAKLIEYKGPFYYIFDLLNYEKKGRRIIINTEIVWPYTGGCNNITCKMFVWKKDSIGTRDTPYTPGGNTAYTNYIMRFEYKIINNEIHIPIVVFRYYNDNGFGYSIPAENIFKEEAIKEVTAHERLAIKKYEVILSEE
jgi:hypothetical protein